MDNNLIEEILINYSNKIFGFCLSKTNNVFEAEDLSQLILMNLFKALKKEQNIKNLDGYVYKFCFYSWSNYVRENIKYWQIEKADYLDEYQENVEIKDYQLINEIKKRIAYLSGLNQKIITMHYYDNINLKTIAGILNINENTVRTNLRRTKLQIKENAKMSSTIHYKPIYLNISHNGNIGNYFHLINLLGQNILYSCYYNPKTIEEIAEETQVATCYLKDYLDQYLYLNWIKLNKNKYQTNFFIMDFKFEKDVALLTMNNIESIAKPINKLCLRYFEDFKSIINNLDISDDALIWFFNSYFSQYLWGKFLEDYIEKNINTSFMTRKDGYKYALYGDLIESVNIENEKLNHYYHNYEGMLTNRLYGKIYRGLTISILNRNSKLNSIIHGSSSIIYDTYELELIYNLINNNKTPTEKEKALITKYIREEVIKIVDGKPRWNLIFLEKEQAERFFILLKKMIKEFERTILETYLQASKNTFENHIPKHLDSAMKDYYSTHITITSATLYYLYENGILNLPNKNEVKASSEWFYIYE